MASSSVLARLPRIALGRYTGVLIWSRDAEGVIVIGHNADPDAINAIGRGREGRTRVILEEARTCRFIEQPERFPELLEACASEAA